ncbi:phosphoglycerate mutase family protein [Hyphomonas adhaerens MHS-3]|uniref:Phosphoglycerate mutase family protein n=2 Tax=Hyphomonas adhaerens TaxID=81029 RepID=A0A069E1B5_9PROT|nr:phosphoglycerate mutase family protein [Hyphomonas adhaerens MHS-3]
MTDLPLTASFADEYATLIKTLPEFKRIVTSPLTRCRHLAEQIAADLNRPLTEDHRFREMDFGRWESQAWDTIPRAEIDAWAADFLHARPHGGESVAMLRARVGIALSSLKQLDGDSLVVTHAGVIKVALAQDDTAESHETSIGFGRYVTLDQ